MRSIPRLLIAIWLAVAAILTTSALAQTELDQILDSIEKRGSTLKSMRAQIVQKKWTDILEEFDRAETGTFLFLREQGEVYVRKDITDPHRNHLVIKEGEVLFYQPAIKQAQRHQMGQNKDKAEFLLLGFGGSREDLEKTYQIRLLGEEAIDGDATYILELTPRSEKVAAYFARIVLWVDAERWVPLQQKLYEPTDDYLQVNFNQLELNPKLGKKDFQLNIPRDVQFVGQ